MSASSKKKLRKEQEAAKLTQRQQQEQKEAKKLKGYTIAFVSAFVAVIVVALLIIGISAIRDSGIIERNHKTVKIGNHTLNADQFNYYFIDEFQNTYSEWQELYGESADMYIAWEERYDITKPLKDQKHPTEVGKTYADYFAELALETAKENYALYDAAMADSNYTFTDEEKEDVEVTIQNMAFWGQLYGYSNFKDYLKMVYGKGATEESFREYLTVMTVASSYEKFINDSWTYEDEVINKYNDEHYNEFSSFSYSSFVLMPDDFLEHAEDGSHNHSEDESAKGLIKAEEAANAIVGSETKTYEEFNAAIQQYEVYKEKTATQKKDTLYTAISPKIAEWLADEGRQVGELGVVPYTSNSVDGEGNTVETTVGYYVILFEGRNDNETKLVNVHHMMVEFQGGTEDEEGNVVYSDEEKAAAKTKAEALLAAYQSGGATKEAFEAVVSEDKGTGNYDDAALYENMYPGQKVSSPEFNDWCFAEGRKEGDCEIVETEFGYHVIFFISSSEDTYRNQMIHDELVEADHEAWRKDLIAKVEACIIDISKLSIDITMA